MMPLFLAGTGEEQTVKRITGSPDVKKHLEDLGFNVGGSVTVISELNGDLIVKVRESRIAIDRGLAAKIMI